MDEPSDLVWLLYICRNLWSKCTTITQYAIASIFTTANIVSDLWSIEILCFGLLIKYIQRTFSVFKNMMNVHIYTIQLGLHAVFIMLVSLCIRVVHLIILLLYGPLFIVWRIELYYHAISSYYCVTYYYISNVSKCIYYQSFISVLFYYGVIFNMGLQWHLLLSNVILLWGLHTVIMPVIFQSLVT